MGCILKCLFVRKGNVRLNENFHFSICFTSLNWIISVDCT